MEKKETSKSQNMKNQTYESKILKSPKNPKIQKDKHLPWWVELLFVQIGLPDKFLIKMLRTNKKIKELLKNDKKILITLVLLFTGMAYFYPVVKYSRNKLDCEAIARNYITENKNLTNINGKTLKMLSTNFCNGGDEIYDIKNLER